MSVSEDKKEFTFVWKIENCSMLPHQEKESLKSPEFVVDMWKGVKWHLKLYPRGDALGIYLDRLSYDLLSSYTEMKDVKVDFSWTIESTDPTKHISAGVVRQLKDFVEGYGFDKFLKEIYTNKDLYLPQDILSLQCHFRLMDSKNEGVTNNNEIECATDFLKKVHISRTGIQVQQSSFTWSIPNISTRRERIETYFTMKDSPGLKVTLNFSEIASSVCVPIEIQQTAPAQFNEKQERLFVKCKLTVVNVGKEYRDSNESTHLFKSAICDVWHFPLFIKTANLTQGKYLNQKDTLFLQCEFAFSYKSGVYHWDKIPFSFGSRKKDETSDWCTIIQSICASGKLSDVVLKAGGEAFPAHKLLLSARSSVLSDMFEIDRKEKNSGVVKINDVDPLTLKRMLTFINFDDIKEKYLSPEDVCMLYEAADKYNVVSLKDWCTQSLLSSLSVERVCDVLVLADAHNDNFLMTSVRNFICCHETETFDSPEWESFMDSNLKLSAKVMHQVLLNRKRILNNL